MANHVHFSVNFHQINEAARAKLQELFSRIRTDNNYQWFSDIFVDGDELTYDEAGQYSWTLENIGPKWCYLEDYSAAEEGLVKLLEILEEHDPNIITSMTYEDEMPNFVGVYVYQGSECYDGFEDEWEELRDRVIAESETLTPESWDEDEDDWVDDEARDTFQEEMWEIIGDSQWQIIHECVDQIKEDLKEQ